MRQNNDVQNLARLSLIELEKQWHLAWTTVSFFFSPAETRSSEGYGTFVFQRHNDTLIIMRNYSQAYFGFMQTRPRNAAENFKCLQP